MRYIAIDHPLAAVPMDQLFSDAAANVEQYPTMGREGKIQAHES